MSLLFWITGNNGLTNQGVSDMTWDPTHVIKETGKTGSCIQFSSTENAWTDALTLSRELSSFTISFWHKITGSTNSVGLLNIEPVSGSTITLSQQDSSFIVSKFPTENPDSWDGVFGEWKHVIYSYNNYTGTHTLYINGFEATKNVGDFSAIKVKFGAGEFCDIRIYDEAISMRQIKDITSGLIAKYPLGNPTQFQKFGLTDSSGFGHRAIPGIETKALSWSDRAVVGYGSFSPNNTNYLKCGHLSYDSNALSLSIWVYFDSWINLNSETFGLISFTGTDTGLSIINGEFVASISVEEGSKTTTYKAVYSVSGLKKGWHMLSTNFIIYPGDSIQISPLIDGKYVNTINITDRESATIHNPNDSVLIIGGTSDGVPMSKGLLSDCRVYATAVYSYAKMYETRVEVDNEGNLYGFGLTDSDDGNNKMTSTGLIGGEIIEGEDKFKAFDKQFKCNEYCDI